MVFWYLKPRYSGTCTLEDVLFLRIPWLNYAADTSTLSSKSSGFHPSFLGVCNGFVRCLGRFWGLHRAIVFFRELPYLCRACVQGIRVQDFRVSIYGPRPPGRVQD